MVTRGVRRKRLTWHRADRALLALVDQVECEDLTPEERQKLNRAADMVRELRDGIKR